MKKIKNYIHGQHSSISSEELNVFDPSTGEECAKVTLSAQEDFNKTIESSKRVLNEWVNTTH